VNHRKTTTTTPYLRVHVEKLRVRKEKKKRQRENGGSDFGLRKPWSKGGSVGDVSRSGGGFSEGRDARVGGLWAFGGGSWKSKKESGKRKPLRSGKTKVRGESGGEGGRGEAA